MPFAAITCGNHELYTDSTIENFVQVSIHDTRRHFTFTSKQGCQTRMSMHPSMIELSS